MRSEAELRQRLKEAIEARRVLLEEEVKAEDQNDDEDVQELTQDIINLSGVITTLEWVLQSGAAPEYE